MRGEVRGGGERKQQKKSQSTKKAKQVEERL